MYPTAAIFVHCNWGWEFLHLQGINYLVQVFVQINTKYYLQLQVYTYKLYIYYLNHPKFENFCRAKEERLFKLLESIYEIPPGHLLGRISIFFYKFSCHFCASMHSRHFLKNNKDRAAWLSDYHFLPVCLGPLVQIPVHWHTKIWNKIKSSTPVGAVSIGFLRHLSTNKL